MAATLYPLIYNSGVQRDGTTFQSTYCTDAQWVRFQRDKIKKIGGMKGINTGGVAGVTNLKIYPNPQNTQVLTFVSHSTGLAVISSDSNVNLITQNPLLTIHDSKNTLWETETVVDAIQRDASPGSPAKSYIVFMKTSNALDINEQATTAQFYRKEINKALDEVNAELIPMVGLNQLINGNLCFASPYMFLFGSNGTVQFSSEKSPFELPAVNIFTASSDKIIFGRPIRGGPSVPSLLLWTLSSVVRVTNTGPAPDSKATTVFKPETISTGSSILSSRCVVEYDGFFFWPGTDRFFVYNGIVDELPNRLNQNYFFDNLDLDRRQQVFGVKNAKYGEIWWFYPVKGVPGNSRAIVYNKRENFWYDTPISREAGTFSNNFGFMATHGTALVNPDNQNYLWRHEFNTAQERIVNAVPVTEPIPSYFLAPLFSWTAFPPKLSKQSQPAQLVNRWVDIQRIEPDFVTDGPANFIVTISTKEYAQSPSIQQQQLAFTNTTNKIDTRAQGRNIALKFSSSDNFEVGQIMLLLGLGDGR
jgi:hypothetical protein